MRTRVFVLAAFAACLLAASAFPRFVTPEMTLRNGLTDEQYEKLWAMGRNPRIDPQTARNWAFRASRYENTTNWFGLVGKTNDFARMAFAYATSNEVLVATNAVLSATVAGQAAEISRLSAALDEAAPPAALAVRVQEALKAEGTLGPYLRGELVKMRDRTEDPLKREVFDSCIALMDSVVNQDGGK